jgi:hypothetical protein
MLDAYGWFGCCVGPDGLYCLGNDRESLDAKCLSSSLHNKQGKIITITTTHAVNENLKRSVNQTSGSMHTVIHNKNKTRKRPGNCNLKVAFMYFRQRVLIAFHPTSTKATLPDMQYSLTFDVFQVPTFRSYRLASFDKLIERRAFRRFPKLW